MRSRSTLPALSTALLLLQGCLTPTSVTDALVFEADVATVDGSDGREIVGELTVANVGGEAVTLSWGGCRPFFWFDTIGPDGWSEPRPQTHGICTAALRQLTVEPGEARSVTRTLTSAWLEANGPSDGTLDFVLTPAFVPEVDRSIPAGMVEWR